MLDWIVKNKEWIFSGVGASFILWLISIPVRKSRSVVTKPDNNLQINNYNSINTGLQLPMHSESEPEGESMRGKHDVRILFVDDDTRFRVVKILQNDGWAYTKIIKDVRSLVSPEVVEADILFIDVQGVGKALGFTNEGLGLALALKKKYPQKKLIIYSTQESGERFNDALRNADDFLSKNADPYEFISIVERMAEEL